MKKGILYVLCLSCVTTFAQKESDQRPMAPKGIQVPSIRTDDKLVKKEIFQQFLDTANVKGAILLYDFTNETYYSNNFGWAVRGHLPASTYKIPNSIIGLETKEVTDQQTVFAWNGKKRMFKSWEADLTLQQAFQRSCVPCYQEVARKIGVKRMNEYLEKLQYGNITVTASNLENFWLTGEAKITQFEQIDFLKRLQQETLPISKRTTAIVKEIMILKETKNYVLRGKTGLSINGDHNNGWFVGYVESNDQLIFFATNVEPTQKDFDRKKFQDNRKRITYSALENLFGIRF
ncbi:MAG: class D beta-lactamase [Bacteroidota bacterium]